MMTSIALPSPSSLPFQWSHNGETDTILYNADECHICNNWATHYNDKLYKDFPSLQLAIIDHYWLFKGVVLQNLKVVEEDESASSTALCMELEEGWKQHEELTAIPQEFEATLQEVQESHQEYTNTCWELRHVQQQLEEALQNLTCLRGGNNDQLVNKSYNIVTPLWIDQSNAHHKHWASPSESPCWPKCLCIQPPTPSTLTLLPSSCMPSPHASSVSVPSSPSILVLLLGLSIKMI